MAIVKKVALLSTIRGGLFLSMWCFFAITASGQAEQTQAQRVADAVKKVKEGNFGLVNVEEIARTHASQAIPALKEQFVRSQDANKRAKIADALVRLGDEDEVYWDFLVKQAMLAVESDAPYPGSFDPQGRTVRRQLSPEFIEWAKAHHIPADVAAQTVAYELPGDLIFLAETGDQRGLPLLRRAMFSDNYLIQAVAAKGLAKLQDNASVPIIIAACQKAPADVAPAIAEALVYFNDAQAQTAAEMYLPKDFFKARETMRVPATDPFGQKD
ncbi:MAG: HEAT repeat domain-containing protein [Candidatus Sulfotelmatobacter sp.]